MNAITVEHEAAIFERLLISPDAARAVLAMKFSSDDEERKRELMDKNNRGDIQPEELAQMEAYRRVGTFLAIAQAQARLQLQADGHHTGAA